MNQKWKNAQEWELLWHDTAVNSIGEELKQLEYAKLIGLKTTPTHKTPYNFDLEGKSILDIGSGPYSLLLKCVNFKTATACDPLMNKFPAWVRQRYSQHGVSIFDYPGEEVNRIGANFDEVWIYNVLEHTYNPEQIIKNARKMSKIIRIFEWIDTPPTPGHPQTLKYDELNKWLGGEGKVHNHKRGQIINKSYSGIFKGYLFE